MEPELRIKKVVEIVLEEMYPEGGCIIGDCYRSNDGVPKLYYLDYTLPDPIRKGRMEFTQAELTKKSDKYLEDSAVDQIESS
ncbi:MAG: hypothetical protein ACQ9MH_12350 [Nitrospinales bacterium]